MNDFPQIEETEAFRLYETEAEYWEEYDRLKTEVAKTQKKYWLTKL